MEEFWNNFIANICSKLPSTAIIGASFISQEDGVLTDFDIYGDIKHTHNEFKELLEVACAENNVGHEIEDIITIKEEEDNLEIIYKIYMWVGYQDES